MGGFLKFYEWAVVMAVFSVTVLSAPNCTLKNGEEEPGSHG
jgi:hypothetical protein